MGKIWFSTNCNYALVSRVPENRQIVKLTPIALLKAVKNDVEADGMRIALIKDAAAVIRFDGFLYPIEAYVKCKISIVNCKYMYL